MNYMDIIEEIQTNRKKFRVDHFDIVISEYITRYNTGKLVLDPPYQRKFRWDIDTQSALIESILIGIPLPPIFVFSNENYHWEIIDGLQRTTTLINFLTNKKDSTGELFRFSNCSILTNLNGKTLDELPTSIRDSINNARIRIELVEDNDDAYSQYLLFSRLNNNGESLSHQELRNFLIYKLNPDFYTKITTELKELQSYQEVMSLPSERINKQEDVEYIVRFFICRKYMENNTNDLKSKLKYKDIPNILTSEIQDFLKVENNDNLEAYYKDFTKTFDFISKLQDKHGYKAFNRKITSLPNVSIIAPAISLFIDYYLKMDLTVVRNLINDFYNSEKYIKITKQSYSPVRRFFELSTYAYQYFDSNKG